MHIIVAMTPSRGIGRDGGMPWDPPIPDDMRHFRALTMGQTVIMGRKTWDSLPESRRPLPGRRNVVLTRGNMDREMRDPENADAWIIGGGEIYAATMAYVDTIHATVLFDDSFECDVFFPEIDESIFELRYNIVRATHAFKCYVRRGVECPERIVERYRFFTESIV
jgi:dihydrofolate reductase